MLLQAHNSAHSVQAYLELQEYESAQHCLLSAQAKKPFDSDISSLLIKVSLYVRLWSFRGALFTVSSAALSKLKVCVCVCVCCRCCRDSLDKEKDMCSKMFSGMRE